MKNYLLDDKFINKLFFIEIILVFNIVIFIMFKKNTLVSVNFTITFLIEVLIFILLLMRNRLTREDLINLSIFILICTISFIAVTRNSNNFSFNYYKKIIMFIATILILFIISKININKKFVQIAININMIIAMSYLVAYYLGIRTYYAGGLTFNFINPNLTAIWLLHSYFMCMIARLFYSKRIIKSICLIIAIYIAYFIVLSKSRTCLIILCVFTLFYMIAIIRDKIKINKIIIKLFIWSPFIILIIYMKIIDSPIIKIFNFFESDGKSLYSRIYVWREGVESFLRNPILGDYFNISDGMGISQMHNTHLDILASYGGIVFLLTMSYIYRIVNKINYRISSSFQYISMLAFISIIFMGFGEAALFSGGTGIYILTGSFLMFSKYNINE